MKLLVFSDLHSSRSAAKRLVEQAVQVDLLIGAGDFATVRHGIEITIDILRQTGKTAVFVPGNNESLEELVSACQQWPNAHILHGTHIRIEGINIFGLGGGIPITPFGSWSYDFSEAEATQLLNNAPTPCDLLITHSPPFDAVDLSSQGRRLGSQAVRQFIEAYSPRLVVCGHIHASAGKQTTIGETAVVNAGPAGLIIDL